MAEPVCPDVIVYLCRNCIPEGGRLPRQWRQESAQNDSAQNDSAHVVVREVPCSGKIDGQYLLHALEGGVHGLCVVGCPEGKCTLVEGNARAEVRIRMIRRVLTEIGIEPDRVELVHASADETLEQLEKLVRDAVARICKLGESPIRGFPAP